MIQCDLSLHGIEPEYRRNVGTTFQQSETACCKKKIAQCPSSNFEEGHHHEFQFCHEEFSHDEDDEDGVCGKFPCCSLYQFHPVFRSTTQSKSSFFPRIADSDFDAFVCSDELVCRAALFPPYTRLFVADSLVLLRHNLDVVE